MSLAIVHSRAQVGVEAPAVTVEAHLANGLPSLTLVGLPETAVKESKDRVRRTGSQAHRRRLRLCCRSGFSREQASRLKPLL